MGERYDDQDRPIDAHASIDARAFSEEAEGAVLLSLRRRGLIRPSRPRWAVLMRPLAIAATIVLAFVVGTRFAPGSRGQDRRVPAPPVGVGTTLPEMQPPGEAMSVAFHMADPLDRETPADAKGSRVPGTNIDDPTPSATFHMSHPLDQRVPNDKAQRPRRTFELAAGSVR